MKVPRPTGRSLTFLATALAVLVPAACGDAAGPVATDLQLHFGDKGITMYRGESFSLPVRLRDAGGNTRALSAGTVVTWATSDRDVVSVSNGVVQALAAGSATVVATSDRYGEAEARIIVIEPYLATILGTMGGRRSNAWAVSSSGVVAGWTDAHGGRSFHWTAATGMTDMLGQDSGVRGISGSGSVTGYARTAEGHQAFVFADGARKNPPPLMPGDHAMGTGINRDGTVAGSSGPYAVVWHLTPDGDYGAPVSSGVPAIGQVVINDAGNVAFTTTSNGRRTPVLWLRNADGSYAPPRLLHRPQAGDYEVMAISSTGVLAGFRWTGFGMMAVAWLPSDYDAPIDLGEGQAWDINSRNEIVGTAGGELPVFGGLPRQAALWVLGDDGQVTGPAVLRPPPGYFSAGARSISDDGWIAGSAWGPGEVVATLWRPSS